MPPGHLCPQKFNEGGSSEWLFLMHARATGLGTDLAGIDAVVLFDSEWSANADIQVQAKATAQHFGQDLLSRNLLCVKWLSECWGRS